MSIIKTTISFLSIVILSSLMLSKIQADNIKKIQLIDNDYYINDLKLQDFDGNYYFLRDKRAKFYIINLWASWCAPCVKEMGSLNSLQKKLTDIVVITISEDSEIEAAQNFFKKNNYVHLEKYYDFNKDFISKIKIRGLPTTFIADEKYKIFAKVEGAIDWNSKEFVDWLYNN